MASRRKPAGPRGEGKPSAPPRAAPEAAAAAASPNESGGAPGDRWIAVADVARPHGVRGELRLRVFSGDPSLLLRRPPIRLRDAEGRTRDARIVAARPVDRAVLAQIEGVGDRDAAEAMRGLEILVHRDEFAPLDEGEFYACDIEGARAELLTGELVGTVTGLGTYPTCDVLLIDHDGKRLEVPILPQFVESVDAAAKLVKIVTLEGL